MWNYLGRTVLASMLVLLVASPLSAGQLPDTEVAQEAAQDVQQAVAQDVDQEVVQQLEPAQSEQATTLEQEALPVAGELVPGVTDPLPEPEEVLKTKTKSNQSND